MRHKKGQFFIARESLSCKKGLLTPKNRVMKNKKGQFFIASIVMLSISIFILMNYFLSIDEAGVVLFGASSDIDFQNVVNAVEDGNTGSASDSCAPPWLNTSFVKRRNVTITNPSGVIDTNWAIEAATCANQTIVYDHTDTQVAATGYDQLGLTPPLRCGIVLADAMPAQLYWIYYENAAGAEDLVFQTGEGEIGSGGDEEAYSSCQGGGGASYVDMCEHLNQTYSVQNIEFSCSSSGSGPYNYTILFNSESTYFYGNLTS